MEFTQPLQRSRDVSGMILNTESTDRIQLDTLQAQRSDHQIGFSEPCSAFSVLSVVKPRTWGDIEDR